MSKQILVYNHIPKTAGITLNGTLARQYRDIYYHHHPFGNTEKYHRLKFQKKFKSSDMCVITGHIFYDYSRLKSWDFGKFTFFTMLREPIGRLISYYYYIYYNLPFMVSYNARKGKVLSFREWCANGNDNHFIRYILSKWGGVITLQDYYEAKQKLETDYLTVGIMEKYEESLYLLYKHLKWNKLPYYHYASGVKTKLPEDMEKHSVDDIEFVTKLNKFDIELYNHFQRKLDDELTDLTVKDIMEMDVYRHRQKRIDDNDLELGLIDLLDDLGVGNRSNNGEIGIYLFGTGQGGRCLNEFIQNSSDCIEANLVVKGFFDNIKSNQDKEIDGMKVFAPQKECIGMHDYVILASLTHHEEMKKQLLAMGIQEDKIVFCSYLLKEKLLKSTNIKKINRDAEFYETVDELSQAIVNHCEDSLVAGRYVHMMKNDSKEIKIYIHADGEQKQFILRALSKVIDDYPLPHITCVEQCSFGEIDLYVIGIKKKWNKFVEGLLEQGVDVEKFLFIH